MLTTCKKCGQVSATVGKRDCDYCRPSDSCPHCQWVSTRKVPPVREIGPAGNTVTAYDIDEFYKRMGWEPEEKS